MKVFVSAGEPSSDRHGAHFLRALRALAQAQGQTLQAFGIGGPELKAEGLETLVEQRELKAMGFTEVLAKIPRILGILSRVTREIHTRKPDVCVVLDYPDFHLRLAARAQPGSATPWVYFIPPKVWVWRSHRVEQIRKYFKRVLSIFPFETEWHRARAMPVEYVGNPLMDELPLALTRAEARAQLGLNATERVVLLMPGSRSAELSRHLAPMWEAAHCASRTHPLTVCIALVSEEDRRWVEHASQELQQRWPLEITLCVGASATALKAADAGLIKSGTSTLEAALMGLPHVLVYKISPLSTWVYRRWAKYTGWVGLPNLVLNRGVVPEVVLEAVTAARLEQELRKVLLDPAEIAAQKAAFVEVAHALSRDGSPSQHAARAVWELGHAAR